MGRGQNLCSVVRVCDVERVFVPQGEAVCSCEGQRDMREVCVLWGESQLLV